MQLVLHNWNLHRCLKRPFLDQDAIGHAGTHLVHTNPFLKLPNWAAEDAFDIFLFSVINYCGKVAKKRDNTSSVLHAEPDIISTIWSSEAFEESSHCEQRAHDQTHCIKITTSCIGGALCTVYNKHVDLTTYIYIWVVLECLSYRMQDATHISTRVVKQECTRFHNSSHQCTAHTGHYARHEAMYSFNEGQAFFHWT